MENEFMILKRSMQNLLSSTGEVQEGVGENFRKNSHPEVMKKFSADQLIQLYYVYDSLYNKEKHSSMWLKVTLEIFMKTFWDCVQAKMKRKEGATIFIKAFHGYRDGAKDLTVLRFLKHWAGLPDKCIGKEVQFFGYDKDDIGNILSFFGKVEWVSVDSDGIEVVVDSMRGDFSESAIYIFSKGSWIVCKNSVNYLGQLKVFD